MWTKTEGKPAARLASVVAVSTLAAFLAYIWWPNGDYRPIQRGEKGTIQGAVEQFAAVPTGRPALTKQRERQLGGAPFKDKTTKTQQQQQPVEPASTTETTNTTGTTATTETTTNPAVTVGGGATVSTPVATVGTETTATVQTTTTP